MNASHDHKQIKIPCVTLDNYCQENKIDRIDVLKIDVEGAEFQVLQGAKNTITQSKPHMIIELHKKESLNFGHTIDETTHLLKSMGFKLHELNYGL